jgi:hypothetical protein
MSPERHRGGAESDKSNLRHVVSHARIAIHLSEFSGERVGTFL